MEHLKHFFKQKGLYLACLAVVFAATAAGVLALRSVLNHVVELTGTAQEETHIFAAAGPRCLTGPCPEGRMCCGKQAEVREKYAALKKEALPNG